ncbi:MAG: molybdate ABC transporter substrate-binding protein [Planctomycetota bacterium]
MKTSGVRMLGLFCWVLAGCDFGNSLPSRAELPIVIHAAASLKEVVKEVVDSWRVASGREVTLVFEASSVLGRQIAAGAAVDIFISAAPEWLDLVKPIERFDWLSNRLVIVVRRDAARLDLARLTSLALANEQVPAGKYAREALAHAKIALPTRTLYGASVRDVLSKVSEGGADAGIVYATDATLDPRVRIAHEFSPATHTKIVYAAGLLTEHGRDLFDELRSPTSRARAVARGFLRLE